MQPALKFRFERAVNIYALWQAVPADERSDAPAWWWSTAVGAAGIVISCLQPKLDQAAMAPVRCH
jgi:hypothetical protein